jgi:hypothetical protein
MQYPSEQVMPLPQTFPHAPQFWSSADIGVQVPLHKTPDEHEHFPSKQYSPLAQLFPHEPQLL